MRYISKNKVVVLFALNTGDQTKEQKVIRELFQTNSILPIKGAYKGTQEDAWMVELTPDQEAAQIDTVLKLAERFNQESILVIDEDRNAELIFVASRLSQSIGRLRGVSQSEALTKDAWTYAPHNDTYYIAD